MMAKLNGKMPCAACFHKRVCVVTYDMC